MAVHTDTEIVIIITTAPSNNSASATANPAKTAGYPGPNGPLAKSVAGQARKSKLELAKTVITSLVLVQTLKLPLVMLGSVLNVVTVAGFFQGWGLGIMFWVKRF